MSDTRPRRGMPSPRLDEREFRKRYATSRADLDADTALRDEVRNAARTLIEAVRNKLAGKLVAAGENLPAPRQK